MAFLVVTGVLRSLHAAALLLRVAVVAFVCIISSVPLELRGVTRSPCCAAPVAYRTSQRRLVAAGRGGRCRFHHLFVTARLVALLPRHHLRGAPVAALRRCQTSIWYCRSRRRFPLHRLSCTLELRRVTRHLLCCARCALRRHNDRSLQRVARPVVACIISSLLELRRVTHHLLCCARCALGVTPSVSCSRARCWLHHLFVTARTSGVTRRHYVRFRCALPPFMTYRLLLRVAATAFACTISSSLSNFVALHIVNSCTRACCALRRHNDRLLLRVAAGGFRLHHFFVALELRGITRRHLSCCRPSRRSPLPLSLASSLRHCSHFVALLVVTCCAAPVERPAFTTFRLVHPRVRRVFRGRIVCRAASRPILFRRAALWCRSTRRRVRAISSATLEWRIIDSLL